MKNRLKLKSVGFLFLTGLLAVGCGEDEPAKEPTPPTISDTKIIDNGDDFVTVGFTLSNPDGATLEEVGVKSGPALTGAVDPTIGFTKINDVNRTVEIKVSLAEDADYAFIPYIKYVDKEVEAQTPTFGNTTSKKWTLLKEFPGKARAGAVSFTVGSKIYVGLGSDRWGIHELDNNYKDFWEYDTSADNWTQLADFPGGSRSLSFAFAVDGKGYVGSGRDKDVTPDRGKTDLWQFDPGTELWTQMSDLPSPAPPQTSGLLYTVADAANGVAYYGTGVYIAHVFPIRNIFRYSPSADQWTKIPDYPEEGMGFTSFIVGNRLFVGGGNLGAGIQRQPYLKFHSLNFLGTEWTDIAPISEDLLVVRTLPFYRDGIGSKGFSIGDFGYLIAPFGELCKYDVVANSWTKVSSHPDFMLRNRPVYSLIGGVIGGKAYLGMGLEQTPDGQDLVPSKKWAVFDPSK